MSGLNFIGQFYGNMGIPNHTREFAKSLSKKLDLTIIPLSKDKDGFDIGSLKKNIGKPNTKNPSLCFWYPNSFDDVLGYYPVNIGYFIFEYTNIPKDFVNSINKLDVICTASDWGAKVLRDNGVIIKIKVIPGGVDGEVFNSSTKKLSDNEFRFLHIGKVENRKSTELVISSFNKAFKGNKKIILSLLIDNPHINDFVAERYLYSMQQYLEFPIDNIKVFHNVKDITDMYNTHHVGVFPSKAEGIGLPIVEAMACGMPVITCLNSGITEYADKSRCILVENLVERPIYDRHFFPEKGKLGTWLEPTEDELIKKMIYCYEDFKEVEKVGLSAEKWMHENYTWDIAADKFIEVLKECQDQI